MASARIQGENERLNGVYYEYNPLDTPLGVGGMGKVFKDGVVVKQQINAAKSP